MNIKPIKTKQDHMDALAEIESLFDAEINTPDGDKLEVLAILVESYEDEHYPIPLPHPIEAIKYHMESRGLSRKDLEPYIGNRSAVCMILNLRRKLSLNMIRRLENLGIPAVVLVQDYEIEKSRL